MIYSIKLDPKVERDIAKHIKSGNKKLITKIRSLIEELTDDPRKGTGKPERLKYYDIEIWSRRIDKEHRCFSTTLLQPWLL